VSVKDGKSVMVNLVRDGKPVFGSEGVGVTTYAAMADAVKTICEKKRLRAGDMLVVAEMEECTFEE
jgi:hypothetical protein